VDRTRRSGLDVAVNMDTGFGDLLAAAERERVLDLARDALDGASRWYAAALADPGAADPVPSYHHEIGAITRRGGTPVIVQCPTMATLDPVGLADLYRQVVAPCDEALAFELSPVFATHGAIWSDDAFARLLDVPQLAGAKHSSLDRATELRRLAARDALRPEFRVYTGNDLAIDMVTYGSDYLLGLSTFAPEAFAARDRAFAAGSIDFLSWNDALQHLGNVGFRAPVPAYKHSAALYLQLTGALLHDAIHPGAPRRTDPDADRALLGDCARRLHDVEERSPSL
jgi:dihydrodipicolinate synthase/N-acetylneuraminate lyase